MSVTLKPNIPSESMLDYRLPYHYHLGPAIMLAVYAFNKLKWAFERLHDVRLVLLCILIALPAIAAAAHFYKQYQAQRDLSVREGIFVLFAVQFSTQIILFLLG